MITALEASEGTDLLQGTPGIRVCLRDNPGRQGVTTGQTKKAGSRVLVEIEFGPNDKQYKNIEVVERVASSHDPFSLLDMGRFGNPADLRRVLIFEKIKGDLTNIFYSMESSNTDFYPHQFKPVLNFIESPAGRILIADEVGLGKTIEATYVWKEVQARHGARRLLIVCPAMLREKWRRDLRNRFNIGAEIISPSALLSRLQDIAQHRTQDAFVYIVSLESIRAPSDYENPKNSAIRAQLARHLDEHPATADFALFDQVIIDEAHYLRNPSTGNNRIGRLLRDATQNLILLTATPIQLGSENLYQLMRLLDPDVFYDSQVFDGLTRSNAHIVKAQRALWQQPPDAEAAKNALHNALASEYFRNDPVLAKIQGMLGVPSLTQAHRVESLRLLEGRSLLSQYMSRSRKREVMENRVERSPQTLEINFSPEEKSVYDTVSRHIRQQAEGKSGVYLFSLLARQRQMASSIVGAMESWNEKGILHDLLSEDLGLLEEIGDEESFDSELDSDFTSPCQDIASLEKVDSKYNKLRTFLIDELEKNPKEKFVIFAFFKGTLKYLHRRLKSDGVHAILLHGDSGNEKDQIIDSFSNPDGPSILLSSEVGSEGIDLQFCRFLVNYDLPWNPMRVEQRIGRLDRLGQKSKRISIVNLKVSNTIEDRIVMRLYDRINVFRESIGDLEDIMGEMTEEIVKEFLNPDLSDEERLKNAEDSAMALANRHAEQKRLESEAVNLVGFSDYIMQNIQDSRDHGRWLSSDELISFVEDFFAKYYPGTKIDPADDTNNRHILLSEDARQKLGLFIAREKPATHTRIHQSPRPILCVFDPRKSSQIPSQAEFIDTMHPIIQWIKEAYQNDIERIYPVSAMRIKEASGIKPGDYVFCIQRWSFKGLKQENELTFSAIMLGAENPLSDTEAEDFIIRAARHGEALPNAYNSLGDLGIIRDLAKVCDNYMDSRFSEKCEEFEAENTVRCNQQETSAKKYTERRTGELRERLQRFVRDGQERLVPMTEGLIRREEEQLSEKLTKIHGFRQVDPTTSTLAAGIIRVE